MSKEYMNRSGFLIYLEVKKGEARILEASEPAQSLGTLTLGEDVAVTCYNPFSKKILLARTWEKPLFHKYLQEITNEGDICDVRLIGGDNSLVAQESVSHLLSLLNSFDAGRNIINIVSADVNDRKHPESFCIGVTDGIIITL